LFCPAHGQGGSLELEFRPKPNPGNELRPASVQHEQGDATSRALPTRIEAGMRERWSVFAFYVARHAFVSTVATNRYPHRPCARCDSPRRDESSEEICAA